MLVSLVKKKPQGCFFQSKFFRDSLIEADLLTHVCIRFAKANSFSFFYIFSWWSSCSFDSYLVEPIFILFSIAFLFVSGCFMIEFPRLILELWLFWIDSMFLEWQPSFFAFLWFHNSFHSHFVMLKCCRLDYLFFLLFQLLCMQWII